MNDTVVFYNGEQVSVPKEVAELSAQEQELISLRYDGELSMEEIGKVFGISKMAVSKRLKKLHAKLRSSVT